MSSKHVESRPRPALSVLTPGDEDAALATIVLAFSADPMARWSWPEPRAYLDAMPRLARAFGGRAFAAGTAYGADGVSGAALWLGPGVSPDEEGMVRLFEQTAPASIRADGFALFEKMGKMHPREPHWYLPLIGVDPACQGRGLGEALMRRALERCDREGVPAYLESSNPRNASLYRRLGFEDAGSIQSGSSPALLPMLRRPRRAGARRRHG